MVFSKVIECKAPRAGRQPKASWLVGARLARQWCTMGIHPVRWGGHVVLGVVALGVGDEQLLLLRLISAHKGALSLAPAIANRHGFQHIAE